MSNYELIADLLAKTTLFGALGPIERRAVAEKMRGVTFEPRQLVFARGDAAKEFYLVKSGRVRLSILTAEGRELSLAHATDGTIFGEIAVLDGGRRTAYATAISRVDALSLSRSNLLSIMESTPVVAQAVIGFLCQRLRDTDEKLEAVAMHPIEVRLARFFVSMALLQNAGANGKAWPLSLDISQSELALLVGASRPKVNAALTTLEDIEAIRRTNSTLYCDMDALRAYSNYDSNN